MNPENSNKLYSSYPKLFRQKGLTAQETCMRWGICCGDGWVNIIDDACRKLSELAEKENVTIEFSQIKEKFGGLRIYIDLNQEKSEPVIDVIMPNYELLSLKGKPKNIIWEQICIICDEAEMLSVKTCERCGLPGEIRDGGWITCLCGECNALKNKA